MLDYDVVSLPEMISRMRTDGNSEIQAMLHWLNCYPLNAGVPARSGRHQGDASTDHESDRAVAAQAGSTVDGDAYGESVAQYQTPVAEPETERLASVASTTARS